MEYWRVDGDLQCAALNDEWEVEEYSGRRIGCVLRGGVEEQLETAECGVKFGGAGGVVWGGCLREDVNGVDGGELIDGFALQQEGAGGICIIVLFIEGTGGCNGVAKGLEQGRAVAFGFCGVGGIYFTAPGTAGGLDLLLMDDPCACENECGEAAGGKEAEGCEGAADSYAEGGALGSEEGDWGDGFGLVGGGSCWGRCFCGRGGRRCVALS